MDPYMEEGVVQINAILNQIVDTNLDNPGGTQIADDTKSDLYRSLEGILLTKEDMLSEEEANRREEESGLMEMESKAVELEEAARMLEEINDMLKSNQFGTLTRGERSKLTKQIINLVNQSVTNSQIKQQLDEENIPKFKDIFNALVDYYTAMAAYSYDNAPAEIAKLGLIISGITMIGGSIGGVIISPPMFTPTSGGTLLLFLASYISTPVTIGVGIYCLKQGGVPVEAIASNMSSGLLACLQNISQGAVQGLQSVSQGTAQFVCSTGTMAWRNLVSALGSIVTSNFTDILLDNSSASSKSTSEPSGQTIKTQATIASEATAQLHELYNSAQIVISVQENPIDFAMTNFAMTNLDYDFKAPPGSPNSQSQLTQESDDFDVEAQQLTKKSKLTIMDGPGGASSGGKRKTKRNKKSKKCKKGCKRNKTKKHKKQHKTLKRCKSKMKH